jgi:hypothetical protein
MRASKKASHHPAAAAAATRFPASASAIAPLSPINGSIKPDTFKRKTWAKKKGSWFTSKLLVIGYCRENHECSVVSDGDINTGSPYRGPF